MNALEKTLAIVAFLILVSQTIRHAYVLWLEPRGSVLDKYDRPLQNEITQATSLEELVRRYEPVRNNVDTAREEAEKTGRTISFDEQNRTEPYKSENALRQAINEWEQKSKEIFALRFFWFTGLGFFILGLAAYRRLSRWLGIVLLVAGFAEFIYWTSPTFLGSNTREFDRLLVNKLVFSVISWVLLLVVIRLNGIFADNMEKTP